MVINDVLVKAGPVLWSLDPESENTRRFNELLTAADTYYRYLYKAGTLKNIALRYYEDDEIVQFIADTEDFPKEIPKDIFPAFSLLKPYYDGNICTCYACGGASLSWTMHDYRSSSIDEEDENGCVSHIRSCVMCRNATNRMYYETMSVRHNSDTQTAAVFMWDELYICD